MNLRTIYAAQATACIPLLAITLAACGSNNDDPVPASNVAPTERSKTVETPRITERDGQYIVTMTGKTAADETRADAQCEQLQAHWPTRVDDTTIYFIEPGNETYSACVRAQ